MILHHAKRLRGEDGEGLPLATVAPASHLLERSRFMYAEPNAKNVSLSFFDELNDENKLSTESQSTRLTMHSLRLLLAGWTTTTTTVAAAAPHPLTFTLSSLAIFAPFEHLQVLHVTQGRFLCSLRGLGRKPHLREISLVSCSFADLTSLLPYRQSLQSITVRFNETLAFGPHASSYSSPAPLLSPPPDLGKIWTENDDDRFSPCFPLLKHCSLTTIGAADPQGLCAFFFFARGLPSPAFLPPLPRSSAPLAHPTIVAGRQQHHSPHGHNTHYNGRHSTPTITTTTIRCHSFSSFCSSGSNAVVPTTAVVLGRLAIEYSPCLVSLEGLGACLGHCLKELSVAHCAALTSVYGLRGCVHLQRLDVTGCVSLCTLEGLGAMPLLVAVQAAGSGLRRPVRGLERCPSAVVVVADPSLGTFLESSSSSSETSSDLSGIE